MNYELSTSTILVEFNASVWTARKLDKAVTDEVLHDKSAGAKDAARVHKSLMAGRKELADIQQCVGAARTYVYANSVPWSDSGQRMIPTTRFLKFSERMAEYQAEFEALVDSFVDIYPTLITAQALALGGMFDRADYPSATAMKHRFGFGCDYIPVPSAGDFRIDIGKAAQTDLQERLNTANEARMERAVSDIRAQLVMHLQRMADRLQTDTAPDGQVKQRRFHDTLVAGAYDLCDLVADLNITQDKTLSAARQRLEKALGGTNAETLRTNEAKREDVREEVNKILDLFKF